MKVISIDLFDCEVCNTKHSVKVILKAGKELHEVEVKSCSNCKHIYFFKQICELAKHQTPLKIK